MWAEIGGSGMKTKEFMAKVRSLEFGIIQEGHQLVIRTPGCSVVARVNIFSQQTEIFYFTFGSADRRELLKIISEYTGTPSEDREEEKRYRLRYDVPPLLRAVHAKPKYLYIRRCDGYKDTSFSQADDSAFKTIFTESEISQMDITGFKKEPVE